MREKRNVKSNLNARTQELRRANEILKDALGFFAKDPEEVKTSRLYRYIGSRRQQWSIKTLCRILGVSESGYYRSLRITDKPKRREHLLVRIKEIIGQYKDNDNYGARRIHIALAQKGETVSYSTVYRIMKQNGLIKKMKRHPNGITREDAAAQKSENLIQRDFMAEKPNEKWLSDNYRGTLQRRKAICSGRIGLLRWRNRRTGDGRQYA